jgi:hypothetical protein
MRARAIIFLRSSMGAEAGRPLKIIDDILNAKIED